MEDEEITRTVLLLHVRRRMGKNRINLRDTYRVDKLREKKQTNLLLVWIQPCLLRYVNFDKDMIALNRMYYL